MDNKKNKKFLKLPTYQGGIKALKQFVASNMKYPEEALKNKIEGTVFINYEVNDNGDVISTVVTKGIGFGCDEEALRLVKMLSYNKVKNKGQRVISSMKISINFNLLQPAALINNFQYSYIKKESLKPQNNTVYSYTITIDQNRTNE